MTSVRFDYVPYPLWRRKLPAVVKPLAKTLLSSLFPVHADQNPPQTPEALADYLMRWRLLPQGIQRDDVIRELTAVHIDVIPAPTERPVPPPSVPIRLPAQWEPMERVLLTFPVLYPPLWRVYAQMLRAITPVAQVDLLVPTSSWAKAVAFYLRFHQRSHLHGVSFLHVPTDDIWIRDYGPFVGFDHEGKQAAVDARFAPLVHYPQMQDDGSASLWAAARGIPSHRFDFLTEGGNYWSDGAGTLIVSDELEARHPHMNRAEIERKLHEVFSFDKLIVLPRLLNEETGHIDLLCKLVSQQIVFVNRPNGTINDERLKQTLLTLQSQTNALGQRYQVVELPFPPLYYNWGIFAVWRSYTNSLTVNGRVLVPVFGLGDDIEAVDIYRKHMPDFEIIPIDCTAAANGGGAVHCLTKEVPAVRS